jgi:hypothetical protein
MACALLVSAFAAQGASAITGTTAHTCTKTGTGTEGQPTFNTDHCVPGSPSGEFKHVAIAQDKTTKLTGDDAGGVTKLKATVGGIPITLTAQNLDFLEGAWMENKLDASGEHYVHSEFKLTYTEVTGTGAGKECFIYEDEGAGKTPGAKGAIATEQLTATTTGQGDSLKITPAVGTIFARFWITDANHSTTNCVTGGTYEVSGSVTGKPNGATVNFTHTEVTTANTLFLGKGGTGFKAGLEGSVTLKGEGTPLSVTTVTT